MACVGSGRKQVCWSVVMTACYSDFLSLILNELLPYNPTLQISPGILGCLPSVAPQVVFNLPPSLTLFIPIKQRRATVSLQCSCCGFRMTGSEDTARTVIGIIGNVISFFLFLSPCPTFSRIVRKKSTEEFEADPYLATVLNCSLWVFYGLPIVHPHSILVATINGTGLVMELAYLTIFFIYTTKGRRLKMVIWLCIEASAMASVVVVTILGFHSHASRSNLVGAFCVVLNVMMYGSPLTITKKVITTKSVEFMPFYLSLTNFLNGLTWLIFALIRFDLYVAVGNGLGAIFGALQLILYAIYFRRTPESDTHIMYTSQWRSHQEDGCSSPPPFGRPSSPLLPPTP